MLLKKEGYPDDDELVMCTVTKVQFHSVFVNLDEYGKHGMIHISEVSPGRIRNIRDFVKEDKKVVCKVLKINKEKGHIDLSLRRVTEAQKRNKVNEIKQQQKAEKILEYVARDLKLDNKKLFSEVSSKILKNHDSLYSYFQGVASGEFSIKESGMDTKAASLLEDAIKARIKEQSVKIEGSLHLTSYDPAGVEVIKKALAKAQAVDDAHISIKYLGSGMYKLSVVAKEYKGAEKLIKDAYSAAISYVEKHDGVGEFQRSET